MASQWFYQVMGEQIGPISSAELRNLAQRGTISIETPIANAASGPWLPAERVKGLFAAPSGMRPSAKKGAPQVPPRDAATESDPPGLSIATKTMMGTCGAVCVLAIGFLVWYIASRDTWELDNASRISARLEEADRLQRSDPLAAYKTYDEVLNEAKQHKITDERFAQKLANAEKCRAAAHQKVEEKIRAEEAERQRLAEEETRRAAAEKRRVAEEQKRKRATAEAQRIAEGKRRAEEKQRQEALAVYHNAPKSAHDALNAVKKVEARTEVGLAYKEYSTLVGEVWADVKIFTESPEGNKLPAFSSFLVSAMGKYRLALDVWRGKIDPNWFNQYDGELSDKLLQECWRAAHRRIAMAESLISQENVASILRRVAALEKADANYESAVRPNLLGELNILHAQEVNASQQRELAEVSASLPTGPQERAKYEKMLESISQKRKALSQQIDELGRQDKQGTQGP